MMLSLSYLIRILDLQGYSDEDIREQELKCLADRNREWKYDAETGQWACPLRSDDDSLSEAALARLRGSIKAAVN